MTFLLKSLQVGSLQLKNRLVMPPMATSKADADGKVNQTNLDYYAEKTKGGYLALVIIEHSFISLQGKASQFQLSVAEDEVVPNLKKLAEVIQPERQQVCDADQSCRQCGYKGSNRYDRSRPFCGSASAQRQRYSTRTGAGRN